MSEDKTCPLAKAAVLSNPQISRIVNWQIINPSDLFSKSISCEKEKCGYWSTNLTRCCKIPRNQ